MDTLTTPPERFEALPGFPYDQHAVEVEGLEVAYLDEGDPDADETFLLVHGEPTWSYLYRHVVDPLAEAGRVVAPDLVGFGRSEKPAEDEHHTYDLHARTVRGLVDALDLDDVTLVGQDWGGPFGFHVAARQPDRFARLVAANTFLPDGTDKLPEAWHDFHDFVRRTPDVPVGFLVRRGCHRELPEGVVDAYDAPFPDASYKAGARRLPELVPQSPDHPAADAIRGTRKRLKGWEKPALCVYAEDDPIMRPAAERMRELVPPARDEPLVWLEEAAHFLQEDAGERLAEAMLGFVDRTPRG
jgi:haloalkane dehalogenase